MKRSVIIISVLLCTVIAQAQDSIVYRSIFGDSTTNWEGICVDTEVSVMMKASRAYDTAVVEGHKYQLQRDATYYLDHYNGPHQPYYVRESESRDKVYVRFHLGGNILGDTVTTEILVMDLSLNVGDTLNTQSWEQCTCLEANPSPRIMIDSIFYLDGRKMMRTNCIAQHYYCSDIISDTLYFIEGVGPSMGIGFPIDAKRARYNSNGILLWEKGYSVRCHFSDSILDFHHVNYYSIYLEGEDGCSFDLFFDKIQESEEQQIEVYPNPAQDKITISGSLSPQSSYKIATLDGKVMSEGLLPNDSNTIDINSLRKGVYLICIEDNKNIIIRKIVKL